MEKKTAFPPNGLVGKDHPSNSEQPSGKSIPSTQFLHPTPGLPNVLLKLAQQTWNLKFIKLEEFLPNNKIYMMLENPSSVQEVVLRVLKQLQQSGRKVRDILTWICCFSLYVAVMAKQWPELVELMISHIHIVMGLAFLPYGNDLFTL